MSDVVNEKLIIRGLNYDQDAITELVIRELTSDLGNAPTLEALASRFFVSSRTFSRRLRSVGRSYRKIVGEVRRREAIDKLTNSRISIAEISKHLGYSDASNFTKAFKAWTGKSPNEYRLLKRQSSKAL